MHVVLVQAAGKQHLQCLQDGHQEAPDWRRESCVEDGASSALVVLVRLNYLGLQLTACIMCHFTHLHSWSLGSLDWLLVHSVPNLRVNIYHIVVKVNSGKLVVF